MNWFKKKPSPDKYNAAVIKVATNLYQMTAPGAKEVAVELQFSLPDSRYRYMLFCLSTAFTAALIFDEKKSIRPPALMKGCLDFATWLATERPQDCFMDSVTPKDPSGVANRYFMEFLKSWSRYAGLEHNGHHAEIGDLIATMVHSTETNSPVNSEELKRLGPLALEITCRLPAMNGALLEMVNQ